MPTIGRPRLHADDRTRWRENKRIYRKAKQRQLKVYHRSLTTEWETPQDFFNELHAEFGFTLDVASQPGNAKCTHYFTPEDDGLSQPWHGICWMNPPYGKAIALWIKKAYDSAQEGATVVCLVPARTEMGWWHTYALRGEIRFVQGRLKFGGMPYNAPFPNAIIIFRPPHLADQEVPGGRQLKSP